MEVSHQQRMTLLGHRTFLSLLLVCHCHFFFYRCVFFLSPLFTSHFFLCLLSSNVSSLSGWWFLPLSLPVPSLLMYHLSLSGWLLSISSSVSPCPLPSNVSSLSVWWLFPFLPVSFPVPSHPMSNLSLSGGCFPFLPLSLPVPSLLMSHHLSLSGGCFPFLPLSLPVPSLVMSHLSVWWQLSISFSVSPCSLPSNVSSHTVWWLLSVLSSVSLCPLSSNISSLSVWWQLSSTVVVYLNKRSW